MAGVGAGVGLDAGRGLDVGPGHGASGFPRAGYSLPRVSSYLSQGPGVGDDALRDDADARRGAVDEAIRALLA